MTTLSLRDYQEEAIAAVLQSHAAGRRRGIIVLPPGAGKTIVFSEVIRRLGQRTVVLVHREELLDQAADKLRMVAPTLTVGVIQAERNELDGDVLVCSVPTLANLHRREHLPNDIGLVVADECHHGAAASWRAVLHHLRAGEPTGPFLLGVTASPDRGDGQALDGLFEAVLYEADLLDLIERDYLAPLVAKRVIYRADFTRLQTRGGDVTAGSAERAFLAGGGPLAVAKAIQTEAITRRSILVFCPGIASAKATAAVLNQYGVAAAAISGETPSDERRATIERFRDRKLRVLVNCQLLTEGVDIPQVDCIVLARPTQSRALFLQMCGRGFRKHPAKTDTLLLDLTANSSRLELVTPASLVGLEPGDVQDGEDLAAAVSRKRQAQQLVAVGDVAIRSEPINVLHRRRVAWIATPDGRYVLPRGDGELVLRPDAGTGDRWLVIEQRRDYGLQVVARDLTIGYAMAMAEERALQAGAGGLLNPRARWRENPATEAQLAYMKLLGVELPPGFLSKGDAHALIAAAKAARISA